MYWYEIGIVFTLGFAIRNYIWMAIENRFSSINEAILLFIVTILVSGIWPFYYAAMIIFNFMLRRADEKYWTAIANRFVSRNNE